MKVMTRKKANKLIKAFCNPKNNNYGFVLCEDADGDYCTKNDIHLEFDGEFEFVCSWMSGMRDITIEGRGETPEEALADFDGAVEDLRNELEDVCESLKKEKSAKASSTRIVTHEAPKPYGIDELDAMSNDHYYDDYLDE